jgi:hypothetical protein
VRPLNISRPLLAAMALAFCAQLTGCVVVGGSSNGHWFIWPGGLGLLLMILLLVFLLRRR